MPGRSPGRGGVRGTRCRRPSESATDRPGPTIGTGTTRHPTRWWPRCEPGRHRGSSGCCAAIGRRWTRSSMRSAGDDADERRRWQVAMADLRRRDPRRRDRRVRARLPDRPPVLGAVQPVAGARHRGRAVVARLPIRRARRLGRRPVPVPARPVAGARLCRARPDADAPLADRRRDGRRCSARSRWPRRSTLPARPAT